MRLPNSQHTSRPWRIHELTPDFRVEDVWALPTPGRWGDFGRLVEQLSSADPGGGPLVNRALFAIRWWLGALLDWDDPRVGADRGRPTLCDRMPADLRAAPSDPAFRVPRFTSLYLLEDEWAAEIINRTVHGVLHIGWVPNESGGYRGQMAVLVKPNGLLGSSYLQAIRPFRYLLVYPALMRQIADGWRRGAVDERTSL